MGLDMYLSGKRYMSKYFDPADSEKIEKVNEIFGVQGIEDGDYGAQEVTFRLGYWRKANAIHNWFVENVQNGEDDCGRYYVSTEKLEELKADCEDSLRAYLEGDKAEAEHYGSYFWLLLR